MGEGYIDLWRESEQKRKDLNICIKQELRKDGIALAEAEKQYRIATRLKTLELRDSNPATLVPLLVKGDEEVAELRFQRDVAMVTYDACRDAINAIKLELRILEAQLQREYAMPNSGVGSF